MRTLKKITALSAAALLVVGLAACEDEPSSQEKESAAQQSGYDKLTAGQPAQSMSHSPTRETINFWIETWNEPGKLSYVYLQAANGGLLGYYVLEGLPVSYCAALTPNYDIKGNSSGGYVAVPAPAMDGVYYGGGGSCDTYYGKDATTGAYVEYTAGMGINVLLFEEPMPRQTDVQPLGPTDINDVG